MYRDGNFQNLRWNMLEASHKAHWEKLSSVYGPEGRGFESLTAYHREPIDFNGFAVFILSQDKLHTPFF